MSPLVRNNVALTWLILASGLLSVSMVFLSMNRVRIMHIDLPPMNTKKSWTIPPGEVEDDVLEAKPREEVLVAKERRLQQGSLGVDTTGQAVEQGGSEKELPRPLVEDEHPDSEGETDDEIGGDGEESPADDSAPNDVSEQNPVDELPNEVEGEAVVIVKKVVAAQQHVDEEASPLDEETESEESMSRVVPEDNDEESPESTQNETKVEVDLEQQKEDREAPLIEQDEPDISVAEPLIVDDDDESRDSNVKATREVIDVDQLAVQNEENGHMHEIHANTSTVDFKQQKKTHDTPLEELISDDDRGVKGHVSHLLDWASIGHAKCATSFIMKWLNKHPEVATWDDEVCDLFDNRPAGLVKRLYTELPAGHYKRGFKCPAHFSRRALRYFKRYFSKTRIIVGVRHPVRWFESFYNFRTRHGGANYTLPPTHKLIGECTPETDGICTDRANFHTNLAVFGKTNLTDPAEQNLIRFRKYTYQSTYEISNPVFLYDVAQFYDPDQQRAEAFKVDLQNFLGLKAPMPEPSAKDAGKSSRVKPKAMDICLPEYDDLRKELVIVGKRASMWIRKYFLKSPQVFVSSREHLEDILKEWKVDPCIVDTKSAATHIATTAAIKR